MPSTGTELEARRSAGPCRRRRHGALALAIGCALAACSSRADRTAKERILSAADERSEPAPFDWSKPAAALHLGADDAAARIGSFAWSADVSWTVSSSKDAARRVHVVERHRIRQSANGEFDAQSDVDPGQGKGSETGKHVIYAKGMTYARSRYAPFGAFRERTGDRGRDARRSRDESFGIAGDVAALYGPALRLTPAGEGRYLARSVRRFTLSLAPEAATPPPAPSPRDRTDGGPDEATRRRLAFLDGRVPLSADGELLADAETGTPLKIEIRGAFKAKDDPDTRAEVELVAAISALGSGVAAVLPPGDALPDERKPKGVARALEAAGLKKRGEAAAERAEPNLDEEGE